MSDNPHTEMPRPPSDTVQIAIRVPADWLERADRLIPHVARPGVAATRTDVFRAAIARGLDSFEAEGRAAEAKDRDHDQRRWRLFQRDLEQWVEMTGVRGLSVKYNEADRTATVLDSKKSVVAVHRYEEEESTIPIVEALEGLHGSRFYVDENGEYCTASTAREKAAALARVARRFGFDK